MIVPDGLVLDRDDFFKGLGSIMSMLAVLVMIAKAMRVLKKNLMRL